MNNNTSKKALIIVMVLTVVIGTLCGCSQMSNMFEKESTTTTTTTTTTTRLTTTEDLSTTFKENETKKIYKGLEKDADGEYPYKLATYTTYYHSSDTSRTANLKAAVGKLNNLKIPAGESFSFNQTVGKRTLTAGYKTAKVINNGDFTDGLGGGVCQVSSTVFECVLRANVEIVSRTYHTLKISYVPLGGDATVQWNSKDFKFKNNLGCDVRLKMVCEDGSLTCSLYGKENVDVGDVDISITKSGDSYVLTRTVNGEQNYRTVSHYKDPKPSTTKAKPTKKNETTTKKQKTEPVEESNDDEE